MSFEFQLPLSGERLRMFELSKALTSDIHLEAPNEIDNYLPYQKAGIEYILSNKNVILGDEPGVGKTLQFIGAANEMRAERILVTAPASLLKMWARSIKRFDPLKRDIQVFDGKNPAQKGWLLSSYYHVGELTSIIQLKKHGPFEIMGLDEFHYLKNPEAARSKYAFAENGLVSVSEKTVLISGTSMVNRPMELFSAVKRLIPGAIGDMTRFEYGLKYCAGWKTPWGSWDFSGASNLKELGLRLRSFGGMVRRTKQMVLPQLPPKFVSLVMVEPNKAGRNAVAGLEAYGDHTAISAGKIAFEDRSRLLVECGLNMAAFAIEYIEEIIKSGHEKIIVFAHHREVIDRLAAGLEKHGVVTYQGGDSATKKDAAEYNFQNQKNIKVFAGNMEAAGVGITLTAASYVVIVEPSPVPGKNSQAIDRAHRLGQLNSVIADILVFKGSAQSRDLKLAMKKENEMADFYE